MIGAYWLKLRSSLWFTPSVLVVGAVALALVLIEADIRYTLASRFRPLVTTSPEGARAMLAAISGSMITVAGVVFSITIVTLSLASTQYSPRILRGFMKDPSNQLVLGVFVGIFAYCIVVLGAIRTDVVQFVPSLAVLVGGALSLVGIGFLIHFIHHTALAIQGSNIVAAVAAETINAIERHFPEPDDIPSVAGPVVPAYWNPISAREDGYVQRIDEAALRTLAVREEMVLRSACRIGDFVFEGTPLLHVSGRRELDDELCKRLRRAVTVGRERSVEQDPAWGLRQIGDVAGKALSPSVNDATTAGTCLEWLVAILMRLSRRTIPPENQVVDGATRLILPTRSAAELYAIGLDEVRRGSAGHPTLMADFLRAIDTLSSAGPRVPFAELSRQLEEMVALVGKLDEVSRRTCLLHEADALRARLAARAILQ